MTSGFLEWTNRVTSGFFELVNRVTSGFFEWDNSMHPVLSVGCISTNKNPPV